MQIEAVGDAAGHHVAEQAGERIFLPGHVALRDAPHDLFDQFWSQAGFDQSLAPDGVAQTSAQGNHQLEGAGHSQNNAGGVALKFLVGAIAGIFQSGFGYHQAK